MADQSQNPNVKLPSPSEFSRAMAAIAERSQRMVTDFLSRQNGEQQSLGMLDPLNVGNAFMAMTARMMSDPARLMEHQMTLWQDYLNLWQSATLRMMGEPTQPVVHPEKSDRRFKDEAWQENEVFDFIKQSYLLTARWVQNVVRDVDGLDDHTARKVDFFTRQLVDAMAPSNFAMTNPEVLRTTISTGGENLIKGLENLLDDLERGRGKLRISMTDEEAFTVGENVAVSPGKVVGQNELCQIIQYSPSTDQVLKRPLMIIPPWINKYYILDLRPKNSFVKWAVDQGHTVFMISWVNPDETLASKSFDDYMVDGPLFCMDVIERQTGEKAINVIGYCLGGTLLAITLAWLTARKKADRIATATFFTTMLDFSEPGELGVFIDEESLKSLEEKMNQRGYLDGSEMANTFNLMRANDLIWSFVVNNYLLGKDPLPFDLLYWNSDSTRMPAAMHSFYLRKMYQENRLVQAGGITVGGVPIDLTTIKTPAYFISTREDHIAPWKSTYAGLQLLSGASRFVLAASGHIAGVVNPPVNEKYCFWNNTRKTKDPETWLKNATQTEGSWWPDWQAWITASSGETVPARDPAEGKLKPIEDAPGSYVRVRAV